MKNYKSAWLRKIAVILLSVFIVVFGVSLAVAIIRSEFGRQIPEALAGEVDSQYMYQISYLLGSEDDVEKALKALEDQTNLKIAVIKSTEAGRLPSRENGTLVYGSWEVAENHQNRMLVDNGTAYSYYTDELFAALKPMSHSFYRFGDYFSEDLNEYIEKIDLSYYLRVEDDGIYEIQVTAADGEIFDYKQEGENYFGNIEPVCLDGLEKYDDLGGATITLYDDAGNEIRTLSSNHKQVIYNHICIQRDLENLDAEKNDLYVQLDKALAQFNRLSRWAIPLMIISAIICVLSAIYIVTSLDGVTFWDKIPYAIYLAVAAGLVGLGIAGIAFSVEFLSSLKLVVTLSFLLAVFSVFVCVIFIETTIARIKAGKFWRYTICYYIWKLVSYPFRKLAQFYSEDKRLFSKIILLYIGFCLFFGITVLVAAVIGNDIYSVGPVFIWALFMLAIIGALVVFLAYQFKEVFDGTKRIREGGTDKPIALEKLRGMFKNHAENINSLGEGIDAAVQDRMKSERFKTELITNVSHDIKTPLTSIINYVDLMKKEDIKDPTVLEYMEVLDRQSARLKKLIEDLMEASKASTGNLEVNLEECDVSVILGQAVGEFEDKMTARELVPVVTYPQQPQKVLVDGRHLWRVFDNLLNNICKYAQAGTRVYIDVVDKDGTYLDIVFKNISSSQLNISSEELMERFVRGDSSRNTEGSGLGLSIARSLTELMNGELILEVDGDLFKVTVRFPQK